ncbi:MAG: hypothetical protein M3508_10380, partial [Actinomycetota bacterium]|nr:hypothetical protein [Actinomycetota bacterium]
PNSGDETSEKVGVSPSHDFGPEDVNDAVSDVESTASDERATTVLTDDVAHGLGPRDVSDEGSGEPDPPLDTDTSANGTQETQGYVPLDADRPSSTDEGSASDESESSEPQASETSSAAQSFGPQDVERPASADEGSASDESESSEPPGERDQHHGSASDEEQSSEAQPSETGNTGR